MIIEDVTSSPYRNPDTYREFCVRYDEDQRCRFCAIEESLRQGSTIAVKSPAQIAEVAKAAHDLDGITQMVMTTGTSNGRDRGAIAQSRLGLINAALKRCPLAVKRPLLLAGRLAALGVSPLGLRSRPLAHVTVPSALRGSQW